MENCKSLLWVLVCLIGLAALPEARGGESDGQLLPLIVVKTTKSMQQVLADLKEAIKNNNYVFIRQQNIDSRLIDEAEENDRVILVYFCNFSMLNRALHLDHRVGVFLPCKITLIQRSGHIELVAINPKLISAQLNEESLNDVCDQLTHDYHQILEDTIL
jgi:cytochrome c oxidase cbb3-type subunit 3